MNWIFTLGLASPRALWCVIWLACSSTWIKEWDPASFDLIKPLATKWNEIIKLVWSRRGSPIKPQHLKEFHPITISVNAQHKDIHSFQKYYLFTNIVWFQLNYFIIVSFNPRKIPLFSCVVPWAVNLNKKLWSSTTHPDALLWILLQELINQNMDEKFTQRSRTNHRQLRGPSGPITALLVTFPVTAGKWALMNFSSECHNRSKHYHSLTSVITKLRNPLISESFSLQHIPNRRTYCSTYNDNVTLNHGSEVNCLDTEPPGILLLFLLQLQMDLVVNYLWV